jgi:RnfABCDGE-type electron transport complex B subunit
MTTAILLMGGLGLVVGVGLAIASKIFYVYVDPKILAIDGELPGANCGGCGYPGCTPNAEAIAAGKSSPNSCVAAGPEVAQAIAAILGVSVEAKEPDIALPGCTYGVADADTKYVYDGMNDCRAVALLGGGMKVCTIGCLGLGTCARACPFNAIAMGPKGLPVVDEKACTGCGTCERVCPKHIITLSSRTRRILKEYTTEECTTPCQRACPAGIDICSYIGSIARGNYLEAVQTIKERNPFPTVIGRICPRPCENECRRQYVDEPVAINYLKRYAADYEKSTGEHAQPYKAPDTGRRVAVVGGGVEGLSAAFFSARLGHATALFEAGDRLGGLLRSAIARYRLPADILDWDIEGIADMGVDIQTRQLLGRDVKVADLLEKGNHAVFLAVGGWDSRLVRTGGRGDVSPAPGCHLLIDVMKSGREGYPELPLSGHVIIVGNPNLTNDMVQRCQDLGAETISVLVRDPDISGFDMQRVNVLTRTGISRMFGSGDQLDAVELTDLDTGQTRVEQARHIILASGRIPELIYVLPGTTQAEQEGEATEKGPLRWEAFTPYKQPAHHQEVGLLSEGDQLTDFQAAIKAIAAGRRAAASIHKALYDLPLDVPENVVTIDTPVQNVDRVSHVQVIPRQIMPMADADRVARGAEIEEGFTQQMAQDEANRCLQCGLICYLREPHEEKQAAAS